MASLRASKRLARLQRVRDIEERIARASWAGAERAAGEAEGAARELGRRLAEARAELARSLLEGPRAARWILAGHELVGGLGRLLVRRREDALTRRSQAETLLLAWGLRRSSHEAVVRLRRRLERRRERELARREAVERDELALARDFAGRAALDRAPGTGARRPKRRGDFPTP